MGFAFMKTLFLSVECILKFNSKDFHTAMIVQIYIYAFGSIIKGLKWLN